MSSLSIVKGAFTQDVKIPLVCKPISIRILYGIRSSRLFALKNQASSGTSNWATIVPFDGLISLVYLLNLNEPRSKFVTDRTRVTTCKSNAGLRDVFELSKRLNSGPRHADVRPHMNSHIFTHDSGNSPGVWLLSLGLFGNGTNVIGRGG